MRLYNLVMRSFVGFKLFPDKINLDFLVKSLNPTFAAPEITITIVYMSPFLSPILYGIDVIVATRPFPETVNLACHTWYSRAVSIGSLNSKTNVQGPFISSVGLNLIHSSKPKIYDVTVKFLVRKITCGPFVLGQNKFRFQFGHFWTWILTCER